MDLTTNNNKKNVEKALPTNWIQPTNFGIIAATFG